MTSFTIIFSLQSFLYDMTLPWHNPANANDFCLISDLPRLAVLSPGDCQAAALAGGLVWSDWSRWGRGETVLTGGRLETVRRRYRLARPGRSDCVSVMLDTKPANTGGCHSQQLFNSVPRCEWLSVNILCLITIYQDKNLKKYIYMYFIYKKASYLMSQPWWPTGRRWEESCWRKPVMLRVLDSYFRIIRPDPSWARLQTSVVTNNRMVGRMSVRLSRTTLGTRHTLVMIFSLYITTRWGTVIDCYF